MMKTIPKNKTYCKNGHLRNKKNTYIRTDNGFAMCKLCEKIRRSKKPWYSSYNKAQQRCNNINEKCYYRYGGRGIFFLMNPKDFEFLWYRDKACLMKKPSIDRINNNGHYELNNCRFIELSENISKDSNQKGENNNCAKLTNQEVRNIRKLNNTNQYTKLQLSKKFRIHPSTVVDIITYRRWKHI